MRSPSKKSLLIAGYIAQIIIFSVIYPLRGQDLQVIKAEPPNWWAGMKWNHVQLMLYGKNLTDLQVDFNTNDLQVENLHQMSNSNYAFIDLKINADIKPETYLMRIRQHEQVEKLEFPVLQREKSDARFRGFDSSDIVYLITPDRFVNGDTLNDYFSGMRDSVPKDSFLGRHGGDIQGIINKLDYLKRLGVSAIWINPLLVNDMPISYHGYAATDLYRIDPRFGSIELYKELVIRAHQLDIKIIMDHVSNHIGIYHPWIENLPAKDWLNGSPGNHLINTHRKEVVFDIHADQIERDKLQKGWFVDQMPDLNQRNPYLKKYLIQNTLWWIEATGIDGIREDTFPYSDREYLHDWLQNIENEYPKFKVVGEVWTHDPIFIAPYQKGSRFSNNGWSLLPSVTDFGIFEAFGRVFNRDKSIGELYTFVSRDFIYPSADNLLIFLDNHDVMRLADLVHGNWQRYKMALKILLTMRGIPQIYYGTEIGLFGGYDHGQIRADFPGGFPGDNRNAFERTGRSEQENDIYDFFCKLISIRNEYVALQTGSLTHLQPEEEIYAYFRKSDQQTMLMIVNNNDHFKDFSLQTLSAHLPDATYFVDVDNREKYIPNDDVFINLPAYDVRIFEVINH